jgi:hypothetical protein
MTSLAGPFRLFVPDADPRLTRTHWPDHETFAGASQGRATPASTARSRTRAHPIPGVAALLTTHGRPGSVSEFRHVTVLFLND